MIVNDKVVLLGNSDVGKTCIARRMNQQPFNEDEINTIGNQQFRISHEIASEQLSFTLWDTAGQEKYRSLSPIYLRNTNICLLVYDMTDLSTFLSINLWVSIIMRTLDPLPFLILIGNKSDINDNIVVDQARAEEKRKEIGAIVALQVSAKTGDGIDMLFHSIQNCFKGNTSNQTASTNIDNCPTDSRKSCC